MFSRVAIYGVHHISLEDDSCQVLEVEDALRPNIFQILAHLLSRKKKRIQMAIYTTI